MKKFKKIASLLLAAIMVIAMAVPAMAYSITIKPSGTVPLMGKTFSVYKLLDTEMVDVNDESKGVVYKVPENMVKFYTTYFEGLDLTKASFAEDVTDAIMALADKDSEGKPVANAKKMEAFVKAALDYVTTSANGISPVKTTVAAAEGAKEVVVDDLPLGYYLVVDNGNGDTDVPVSALMLDTTTPNMEVTLKAEQPEIKKSFNDAEKTNIHNKNVGDQEEYLLETKVPEMLGYENYKFVIGDTLSAGLTWDESSLKVEMEDVAGNGDYKELTKGTDYEVRTQTTEPKAAGTKTFEIVFTNFIQYKGTPGRAIKVTYSATINNNAVIGVEGNPNEVTLIYSRDPENTQGGDYPIPEEPIGETPPQRTKTYVTGVELAKVDNENNRLTGARFKLEGTGTFTVLVETDVFTEDASGDYWKLKDGSYTTMDPNAGSMDQSKYEDINTRYRKEKVTTPIDTTKEVTAEGTVGADGVLRFLGLADGTYTITELEAPNGFNMLKEPITIMIKFGKPASVEENCTWTGTYDMNDGENAGDLHFDEGTGYFEFNVLNLSGTRLPSTGGMGTTILYVIGGLLVLSAAVVLVSKKRAAK